MKIDNKMKETFGIYLIAFLGWMICFGMFPVLIFFNRGKKDHFDLAIILGIIALSFFIFLIAILFIGKIRNSEEAQCIRSSLSSIFKTKIVRKCISAIIILCFALLAIVGFWGSTELNKPFNKFKYEAIYKANLSKNSHLKKIERIEVWIKVEKNLFSKRRIILDYIYYNDKFDIDFDEYSEPIYLQVGKFVPVEFYLDGNDYKWYIELSSEKVSDYRYTN